MNYEQAISFLQSFPDSERGSVGSKPDRNLKMPLSSMRSFLQSIDNPQNCVKTIHITGSKGKGSTATFITSILQKAGYRTALFTSPHIHFYTERIAFDLRPIAEDIFAQGLTELKPFIDDFEKQGGVFSTFGILTALFFHLVKKSKPPIDWQIVEVGLGGKDDLTNVFDHKEAAVITPISLEHTAILGSTRKEIAENKAGIITQNCKVILSKQPDVEVVKTIRQICLQKEAQLIESAEYDSLAYPIQLQGEHQRTNAMTALTVIDTLAKNHNLSISADTIKEGLATAFLPGRFEIIESSPSVSIVLDGAHNGDSAQALAKTLHQVFPDRKVVLIIGVNQDKDLESIWHALKNSVSIVVATQSNNYRAMPAHEIRDRILAQGNSPTEIICTQNIDEALKIAQEAANSISQQNSTTLTNGAIICLCGSLYLVAEARERLLGLNT